MYLSIGELNLLTIFLLTKNILISFLKNNIKFFCMLETKLLIINSLIDWKPFRIILE